MLLSFASWGGWTEIHLLWSFFFSFFYHPSSFPDLIYDLCLVTILQIVLLLRFSFPPKCILWVYQAYKKHWKLSMTLFFFFFNTYKHELNAIVQNRDFLICLYMFLVNLHAIIVLLFLWINTWNWMILNQKFKVSTKLTSVLWVMVIRVVSFCKC